jgi:hypothetical protein
VSRVFYLKDWDPFIDFPTDPSLWYIYFITQVKLHNWWAPRLENITSGVPRRLLWHLSWLLSFGVAGAQDGVSRGLCLGLLYMVA